MSNFNTVQEAEEVLRNAVRRMFKTQSKVTPELVQNLSDTLQQVLVTHLNGLPGIKVHEIQQTPTGFVVTLSIPKQLAREMGYESGTTLPEYL